MDARILKNVLDNDFNSFAKQLSEDVDAKIKERLHVAKEGLPNLVSEELGLVVEKDEDDDKMKKVRAAKDKKKDGKDDEDEDEDKEDDDDEDKDDDDKDKDEEDEDDEDKLDK